MRFVALRRLFALPKDENFPTEDEQSPLFGPPQQVAVAYCFMIEFSQLSSEGSKEMAVFRCLGFQTAF